MKKWLSDFPTTQGRIVCNLLLAALTVLVVLGCLVSGRELQEGALIPFLVFVAGLNGADVVQFIGKRATYKGDSNSP